jgi:NAD(P)-dependent dehydrogenase (short-subunit alcohol dehydrogenase family)
VRIEGAVAVVSGGGAGIGRAIARGLASEGAAVVLADRDGTAVRVAAAEISSLGHPAVPVECDVTSGEDVDGLVAATASLDGGQLLVVANAAVAVGGAFEHIPLAGWRRVFDVNVLGVVRTVNAFLPRMIADGEGAVVITSSMQGLFPESGATMAPYVASKAALVGLARALASYLRPLGVNVILLCPSLTATAFPVEATIWGAEGRQRREMNVPPTADSPERVADLLLEALRADRSLVPASADATAYLTRWAADPDAALPPLETR